MPPKRNNNNDHKEEKEEKHTSRDLKRFKPKYSFDCGISITDWLEDNYADAADRQGWNLHQKKENLIFYIKKEAKTILMPRMDEYKRAVDWETFKQHIIRAIQGKGWTANVYEALIGAKQEKDETVSQFYTRFMSLLRDAGEEATHLQAAPRKLAAMWIKRLGPTYTIWALDREFNTIEDAHEGAREVENKLHPKPPAGFITARHTVDVKEDGTVRAVNEYRRSDNAEKRKACEHCHRNNHSTNDCFTCTYCNRRGHKEYRCREKKMQRRESAGYRRGARRRSRSPPRRYARDTRRFQSIERGINRRRSRTPRRSPSRDSRPKPKRKAGQHDGKTKEELLALVDSLESKNE